MIIPWWMTASKSGQFQATSEASWKFAIFTIIVTGHVKKNMLWAAVFSHRCLQHPKLCRRLLMLRLQVRVLEMLKIVLSSGSSK